MDNYKIKTLYIELTHACNQNCLHCYLDGGIHHKIEELSLEQIRKILDEFKEQGGRYTIITGGEPTVRKDCFNILDYIEKLDIPFTFASNSLIMNEERLKELSNYRNLKTYFTSILGSTAEKHNRIACNNSYNCVLNALEYLDNKGINTYVQVTLANDYIKDMPKIAESLVKYKSCNIKFTPIASLGIKKTSYENQSLIVPIQRFKEFNSSLADLKAKYPSRIEDGNIQEYNEILSMIKEYNDEELYSLCYGFLAIRPDGTKSFSCDPSNPYTFGNAKNGLKIPMDDKFKAYIEVLRAAEEFALEKSEEGIIELDTTIDNKIEEIYNKNIYSRA